MSRVGARAGLGRRAIAEARGLAQATRLGEHARLESRRRRLVWIAIAALLVVVPLSFNLARAPDFKASVELFPSAVAPYPPITDPSYYRSFLGDPELRRQMQINVGEGVADYRDVTIDRDSSTGRLKLTVAAATPAKAQRFINGLAPQIAGATRRQLGVQARRDRAKLRARLSPTLPRTKQLALRRQLRRLGRFGEFPPGRVLIGHPASMPRLKSWADRLVADLPGDFPSRPNPAWAALAGLLVAATLWAICLVLMPPGGRRSDGALPPPD
jgi:hypothetical protein